jgi:hypothetical protein
VNGRQVGAHRLAFEMAFGPIPPGMCVCHKCDVRACVNPDHLFLGTHKDNINDKVLKGRHGAPSGDAHWLRRAGSAAHPMRKLDWPTIKEIRSRYQRGERQVSLAAAFGVRQTTISNIVRGVTWAG